MLRIIIASQRKSSDCLLEYIIAHLPTLVFVELMNYFYDTCLSIWKILNLCNFTKNPPFLWMFTINKHLFFDFLIVYFPFCVEMTLYKARKISNKLININLICLSHFNWFKFGISLGRMIIFYYVWAKYLSNNISFILDSDFFFKTFDKIILNYWIITRLAPFCTFILYFTNSLLFKFAGTHNTSYINNLSYGIGTLSILHSSALVVWLLQCLQ